MRIVHRDTAPRSGASAHRPGGVAFTHLLEGEEGALDNFALMLVHVAERYHAPRHRHNFEQVRLMLDGEFGFGPGMKQAAGSIGYFCEGAFYTQDGTGTSTTLLLQVGGPSGQGYMSNRQLRAGVQALQQQGSFHDGVYTWHDLQGVKHNQDSYEAIWEHVMGSPVRYEPTRFQGPVLMSPDHFGWVADGHHPVLSIKHLATFHECGLQLAGYRLASGSRAPLGVDMRRTLAYVLSGEGSLEPGVPIRAGSAFELAAGESVSATAWGEGLEMIFFGLPRLP
jgi:hypothetical protein